MSATFQEFEEKKAKSYKLMLWFAMLSMVMIFGGLTSAYVVSQTRPDWINDFTLPVAFTWSTVIVAVSSVTFYLAQKSIANDRVSQGTIYLLATLLLGLGFVYSQFEGFNQVVESGYFFTGSESTVTTSFLYLIVMVHLAHLFGGLIALLIVIVRNLKNKYSQHDYLGVELAAMYWHFLGILWGYLFLFFYFYK